MPSRVATEAEDRRADVSELPGMDAATHPDFRGIGVYSKLRKYKLDLIRNTEINFYFVVSAHPLLIDKNKREGRLALLYIRAYG